MRRIAVALVVAVVLAGCGGTDWKTSQRSPGKAARSTRAASSAAAERPYVDALVAGARADRTPEMPPATVRCVATAVVHTYGAPALVSAGVTPADFRAPTGTFDGLPDPSAGQAATIGSALQRCGISNLLATALAQGLKASDPATIVCLTGRFGSDPGARRFLALSLLQRDIDVGAARGAVGVMAACVDFPALVLNLVGAQLDPTTRACVVDTLKASDSQLKNLVVAKIAGDDATLVQYQEALASKINRCRPSARTGFTVPSD